VDPACLQKAEELKKYLPVLKSSIDAYRKKPAGITRDRQLETLQGFHRMISRPSDHNITLPWLEKAEYYLQRIQSDVNKVGTGFINISIKKFKKGNFNPMSLTLHPCYCMYHDKKNAGRNY